MPRPSALRSTALGLMLATTGCRAPEPAPELLAPTEAQTKLRNYQSRTIDAADRQDALRAVIGVLQDLGFLIERANEPLGLVTGAKFAEPRFRDVLGVTVTVRQQGEGTMLVRINAVLNNRPIEDPEPYRNFFAALERALVLSRG